MSAFFLQVAQISWSERKLNLVNDMAETWRGERGSSEDMEER